MVYDKDYFLNQMRNGQDIKDIGQAMADAMNEAIVIYNAEQEAARKAEAEKVAKAEVAVKKRELGNKIVDLFREYGELTAPGSMADMAFDEQDMDTLIEALDQTFQLLGAVKELRTALDGLDTQAPAPKKAKSDDEVLADFLATILK